MTTSCPQKLCQSHFIASNWHNIYCSTFKTCCITVERNEWKINIFLVANLDIIVTKCFQNIRNFFYCNFSKAKILKIKSPNQNALNLNELWVHWLHETFPTWILAGLNFELAFFFLGEKLPNVLSFFWKEFVTNSMSFWKKMPKFEKHFQKNSKLLYIVQFSSQKHIGIF